MASALLVTRLPLQIPLTLRIPLTLAGTLLVFGFVEILLRLWLQIDAAKPWAQRALSWSRARLGASLVLAAFLAWPLAGGATRLELRQLNDLNLRVQSLFVFALALGIVLLLRDYAARHKAPIVERATLATGIYLFAALLINSYISWLLLPLPFLVALLYASLWLFRPEHEVQSLRTIPEARLKRPRRFIQDVVDASTSAAQLALIQKSLTEKMNKAELTPEEYEAKLDDYREYLDKKLELDKVAPGLTSRDAIFAVGGEDLWTNVAASVKTGAVLAAGPFLIALYQVLPKAHADYPYPLLSLLAFILSAATPWLLYAFFFGFYFAYLRGKSGLSKGIHFFFALCLPFAVYRLLDAQSLTDMRLFILWATQLFLFFLHPARIDRVRLPAATGVTASGCGTYRLSDNVPALSAYVSTALAALVPTGRSH